MKSSRGFWDYIAALGCLASVLCACAKIAGLDDLPYGPGAKGAWCSVASDCESGVCSRGSCQAPTCADGVRNGDEADIDCGGPCGFCADHSCILADDCISKICTDGYCQAPTCKDNVQNGTETESDCGGGCDGCSDGQSCNAGSDCMSKVCSGGRCQAPTCADNMQNGTETGTDCGGGCKACPVGSSCMGEGDCASGHCLGGTCVTECGDGKKDGNETDVDCGGSCPIKCGLGDACTSKADCMSDWCNGVCVPDPCAGVDCSHLTQFSGGCTTWAYCDSGSCVRVTLPLGTPCPSPGWAKWCDGAGVCTIQCFQTSDCDKPVSHSCKNGVCMDLCLDGVQDANETDKDCGGPDCPGCTIGQKCDDSHFPDDCMFPYSCWLGTCQ